ncbi:MAG: TadE/TadG family type IV pilus assembly protein [Microbacterium sp.]
MRAEESERGAAAVEFALIVLPFLLLIFALVDLGWIFNQQLAVTTASREAIRIYAVEQQTGSADAIAHAQSRAAELVDGDLTFDWSECSATVRNEDASVVVSTPLTDLTGWVAAIAPGATLSATGTMRCGG